MKKHSKTQATLTSIAAVFMCITLLYNAVTIAYSDLSWDSNKPTYRNIFLCLVVLVALYFDHKHRIKKPSEK